jgi:DNA-directed RNA polymerase II subunit RPB2
MIAHGATDFLRESMLDRGDQYFMAVCNKTGAIAVYNPDKNLFMSPMADGPLKFVESLDGKELNVEHVTKYGREFSVVRVPYVFKLLMHELQTINVKMSLITEYNINQFDTMTFSNNIRLLTNGSSLSPDDVMRQIKIVLKGEPAKTLGPEIEIEKEKEKKKAKSPAPLAGDSLNKGIGKQAARELMNETESKTMQTPRSSTQAIA